MAEPSEHSLIVLDPPRRGRPSRADAPTTPFRVRLTHAERDRVAIAARVNRQNVSEFMRDALVTAADDCLEASGSRR